ncbi:hypothetical protein BDM02DRAFT_3259665 [Thelephora ganbajun]|uniref:Uncharacterized protein n=1 Tax=Thelephora ganbajun TaxID=370292 RepID=A0ACB6ZLN6_THEGA|nr:hypothetical protein BDM02DRAFT_3259665 [Thelephora ganbajun]
MHLVFLVNEIFRIICDSIAESDRGLATLAALARTCRSLEGISLDVLWGKQQVDFINVLKTLPPNSWSYTRSSFSLNRPISSNELARLRQYTTRVTDLHAHTELGLNVRTLKTLIDPYESFDWLTMWPKVKTLWWMTSPDQLQYLKHFLTFGVHNLKINLEGAEDEDFQETLRLVESRCMNLEDLHLSDPEPRESQEFQDTIRQIIYNNSLTLKLFYPPQDPSAPLVNDILQLPALQALELHIPQIPDPAPWSILPSLECLTFTLDEPLDMIDLLGTLRESKLTHFTLICRYPEPEDGPVALAEFFEDTGLYDSVKAFSWITDPDDGVLTWEFVSIFDSFANLQALHLEVPCNRSCHFRFRHNHVVELSGWMPRLKELNFGGSPCAYGGLTTDVGYHTLTVLTKNCPDLYLLAIHFNIRTFVPGGYMEPNLRVTLWDVGDTALPNNPGSLTMIALAVSKLFPKVTFIGVPERNATKWQVIHEELQMFTLPAVHRQLDLM